MLHELHSEVNCIKHTVSVSTKYKILRLIPTGQFLAINRFESEERRFFNGEIRAFAKVKLLALIYKSPMVLREEKLDELFRRKVQLESGRNSREIGCLVKVIRSASLSTHLGTDARKLGPVREINYSRASKLVDSRP